jgi:hypothetical protein
LPILRHDTGCYDESSDILEYLHGQSRKVEGGPVKGSAGNIDSWITEKPVLAVNTFMLLIRKVSSAYRENPKE